MPECTDDSECVVVDDCCNCLGIPAGQQPPACNVSECFVSACGASGHSPIQVKCRAGQCVAGFDCDHGKVVCEVLPPDCPAGKTPGVKNGCWTSCVDATECEIVADCTQCSAGQACVKETTQLGPMHHCVEPPAVCNGSADCACMGDAVCVPPFKLCADQAAGVLDCSCPNC